MPNIFENYPSAPLATGDLKNDITALFTYAGWVADYFVNYVPPLKTVVSATDTLSSIAPTTERLWPDGSTTVIFYFLLLPSNYAGGDITLYLARRGGGASGTAVMNWDVIRIRNTETTLSVVATTSIDFAVTDNKTYVSALTIPGTDVVKGDILRVRVERLGADASDTLADNVFRDGLIATYTTEVSMI